MILSHCVFFLRKSECHTSDCGTMKEFVFLNSNNDDEQYEKKKQKANNNLSLKFGLGLTFSLKPTTHTHSAKLQVIQLQKHNFHQTESTFFIIIISKERNEERAWK